MIYQPRNVQPSGVSIDGLLDNTFTMEIQTNSYVSAYQLLIVDFNNNEIYTGSKTTLNNYAYNGDTLEIPVNASTVALSNGTNYKWRVRLYQPTADMLITYGLVQSTSTTTTIYLQPNINIKAGMAITINSQTKTISSYNSDTGVAVVSSAFSSAPAVGTQYKIYSDFIETVPDYIVYARRTPAVAISNVPSSLTLKYHTFQGTYTQSDNVAIVYHQFDLYTRNDDGTISLAASSDKVYSANLSYTYDSFRTGNKYLIQMTVENDMGIISTTDMYEFTVSYDIVEYLQQPLASFDDKNNAVKVSWVTPVENEATSFRSDAAAGIIEDNNNTYTQATFEPGQSIGEGDVIQITNSNCELYIDGKSEQETRSGKNIIDFGNPVGSFGVTSSFVDDVVTVTQTESIGYPGATFDITNAVKNNSGKTLKICYESLDISSFNSTVSGIIQIIITKGSTSSYQDLLRKNGTVYTYTIPSDVSDITQARIKIMVNNSSTPVESSSVSITKPMLIFAGQDETYEQYGVSPSPDYPSEIKSVGCTNLFDKDNANILNAYLGSDKIVSSSSARVIYIPCSPNTTYIIQKVKGNAFSIAYTETTPIIGATIIGRRNTASSPTLTITTGENAKYLVSQIMDSGDTLTEEEILNSIQIEESSIAHNYIPYNKYGIDVNVTGKQLFDNKAKYTYSNVNSPYWTITPLETGIRINTTFPNGYPYVRYVLRNLKNYVGKMVRVKCNIIDSSTNRGALYVGLSDYDASNNVTKVKLSNQDGVYEASFVVPELNENQQYLYIALYATVITEGASGGNVDYTNLIITIDDEDMTYEPYKSNTTQLILNKPLRSLPNGVKDTYENGKVVKRIGRVVLDGSESWSYDATYGIFSSNVLVGAKNDPDAINTMSDYFKSVSYNNRGGDFARIYGNNSWLAVRGIAQTTIDEFKTWLSENNVEVLYELAEPVIEEASKVIIPSVDGMNYICIFSNVDTTFSLVYPYKTISGNTYDYTEFNPPGVKQTGIIKSYNAVTGVGTLMSNSYFTYIPMQGDSYTVISNIYNVSGFSYLYNTPYNTVNSLYTHGYTATWSTPDGLCVLPDDFNITLQFSPDGNFFYDQNGVYQEVVDLITTETDGASGDGEFTIKIDKNKLIFVQNPDISLELPFYTNTTQVFVLSSASVAQLNNDYVWDDTATWTDTYTWVEGGTSLERVCNHWWKVQITNTGIKIEEIFPTT